MSSPMPSAKELFISCVAAVVAALAVMLVMHLVGWGEHDLIAAAIAGCFAALSVRQRPESVVANTEGAA